MSATSMFAAILQNDALDFGFGLDETAEEILVGGARVGVDGAGLDGRQRLHHLVGPARIDDEFHHPAEVVHDVAERLHAQEPEFGQIGPVFLVAQRDDQTVGVARFLAVVRVPQEGNCALDVPERYTVT